MAKALNHLTQKRFFRFFFSLHHLPGWIPCQYESLLPDANYSNVSFYFTLMATRRKIVFVWITAAFTGTQLSVVVSRKCNNNSANFFEKLLWNFDAIQQTIQVKGSHWVLNVPLKHLFLMVFQRLTHQVKQFIGENTFSRLTIKLNESFSSDD